ncbi:unnamed protein product [Adineta steineri]|uniref:RING-type domain-containing protein n=2 Tax=Adineta steineri TaxID=433720 RepID=A0A814F9R8_9BILA|nr:unnamed protein product [Adineta steineri]CAF0980054.1 unnamed protein product [Adineta steineri]CAF1006472.1 unnamed protein product [Adineta steineri]CAF1438721.1 unnamed protein product [Adineta steineri]
MARQYSNRSFIPTHEYPSSDNSSRRYRQSSQSQNNFSYFQYPPHREINNHHHSSLPFSRITASATTPNYRFENPSAASFTRHPPWFDGDWEDHHHGSTSHHNNNHIKRQRSSTTNNSTNSQSYHHHHHQQHRHQHERKRSRNNENEYHPHYQPYSNHRSANPTSHHTPSFSRSINNESYNRSVQPHHQSPPVATSYRQSMPSSSSSSASNTYHHRNAMTFEPTLYHPPIFHQTSMSTHIHQRPSSSFLLNNLLHRIIDAHAASYNNNHIQYHHHHPPTSASIDLIAYAWMSPSHEIFSVPSTFNIQFSDIFDLIMPDETPVVGLTDSELERLPTIIYSKTCKNIKIDDKCAVCLSEYINGEELKRLRCKHYFHSECINPWLKTSTRCPICRGEQTN